MKHGHERGYLKFDQIGKLSQFEQKFTWLDIELVKVFQLSMTLVDLVLKYNTMSAALPLLTQIKNRNTHSNDTVHHHPGNKSCLVCYRGALDLSSAPNSSPTLRGLLWRPAKTPLLDFPPHLSRPPNHELAINDRPATSDLLSVGVVRGGRLRSFLCSVLFRRRKMEREVERGFRDALEDGAEMGFGLMTWRWRARPGRLEEVRKWRKCLVMLKNLGSSCSIAFILLKLQQLFTTCALQYYRKISFVFRAVIAKMLQRKLNIHDLKCHHLRHANVCFFYWKT